MRKFFFFLLMPVLPLLSSCKGDPGPPGLNGVNIVGTTYEVVVDFLPQNDFEATFDFTPPIEPSDVVLTYIEWFTANGNSVWRLLPQTVFFDEGAMQYQFDFTRFDIRIFLEAQFNLSLLGPEWTRNQVFRIVVVPSDFGGRIDYSNYEAVAAILGIDESKIVRKHLNRGVLETKQPLN